LRYPLWFNQKTHLVIRALADATGEIFTGAFHRHPHAPIAQGSHIHRRDPGDGTLLLKIPLGQLQLGVGNFCHPSIPLAAPQNLHLLTALGFQDDGEAVAHRLELHIGNLGRPRQGGLSQYHQGYTQP
jgi:hypothetical protein